MHASDTPCLITTPQRHWETQEVEEIPEMNEKTATNVFDCFKPGITIIDQKMYTVFFQINVKAKWLSILAVC